MRKKRKGEKWLPDAWLGGAVGKLSCGKTGYVLGVRRESVCASPTLLSLIVLSEDLFSPGSLCLACERQAFRLGQEI